MADKTIGELPRATGIDRQALLVMEQQGQAQSVTGGQLLDLANVETAAQVEAAKNAANAAAASKTAAAQSAVQAQESAGQAQGAVERYPRIAASGNWEVWDAAAGNWKDAGVKAQGPAGPVGPAGGVDSFNGRTGAVAPQKGDYTADMVGAAPAPLSSDLGLYVNGATGSDNNPGTESLPFKTVQAAVNSLPKNLGGYSVYIYCAERVADSSEIKVRRFNNGTLFIRKQGSTNINMPVPINFMSCACIVRLYGFVFSFPLQSDLAYIHIRDTFFVGIDSIHIDGVDRQANGVNITGQSQVGMTSVVISNCNAAISSRVSSGTRGVSGISAYGVNGNGNNVGADLSFSVFSTYSYGLVADTAYIRIGSIVIGRGNVIE